MIIDGKIISLLGYSGNFLMAVLQDENFGPLAIGVEKQNRALVKKLKINNRLIVEGELSEFNRMSKDNGVFRVVDKKLGKVQFLASKEIYTLMLNSEGEEKIRHPPSQKEKVLNFLKNKR